MFSSILQPSVINVSEWKLDDQFGSYPEGARAKSAFFPPDNIKLDFINPEKRYLFKRSRIMYPDQFWAEIIAYQIGCLLGVEVPPAFASFNPEDDTCGALIEWFYVDNKAIYVQGGNYMQLAIPDYELKTGAQHNFHSVTVISRGINQRGNKLSNWQQYWGEAFLFDALIGNTDRHQDNWGVLYWKNFDDIHLKAKFSPLFDNGTSLGHEIFPINTKSWTDERFIFYVRRGYHHMKWQLRSPKQPKHIEMLELITQDKPQLKKHLFNMINSFSVDEFRNKLEFLEKIEMKVPLTTARSELYFKLVSIRKGLISSALK